MNRSVQGALQCENQYEARNKLHRRFNQKHGVWVHLRFAEKQNLHLEEELIRMLIQVYIENLRK